MLLQTKHSILFIYDQPCFLLILLVSSESMCVCKILVLSCLWGNKRGDIRKKKSGLNWEEKWSHMLPIPNILDQPIKVITRLGRQENYLLTFHELFLQTTLFHPNLLEQQLLYLTPLLWLELGEQSCFLAYLLPQ